MNPRQKDSDSSVQIIVGIILQLFLNTLRYISVLCLSTSRFVNYLILNKGYDNCYEDGYDNHHVVDYDNGYDNTIQMYLH